MDAYAVYSHCVSMPGLALVDDATLRQKRQDLLYQHPNLVGVELTAIHASQRQLMVSLSGPAHSVLQAKSEILASDAIQVMEHKE
jgi:hypothetical protein